MSISSVAGKFSREPIPPESPKLTFLRLLVQRGIDFFISFLVGCNFVGFTLLVSFYIAISEFFTKLAGQFLYDRSMLKFTHILGDGNGFMLIRFVGWRPIGSLISIFLAYYFCQDFAATSHYSVWEIMPKLLYLFIDYFALQIRRNLKGEQQ